MQQGNSDREKKNMQLTAIEFGARVATGNEKFSRNTLANTRLHPVPGTIHCF